MQSGNKPINKKNEKNKYYLTKCKNKIIKKIPDEAATADDWTAAVEAASTDGATAGVVGRRRRWCVLGFSLCQIVKMKGKTEIYIDIVIASGASPGMLSTAGNAVRRHCRRLSAGTNAAGNIIAGGVRRYCFRREKLKKIESVIPA